MTKETLQKATEIQKGIEDLKSLKSAMASNTIRISYRSNSKVFYKATPIEIVIERFDSWKDDMIKFLDGEIEILNKKLSDL